MKITYIKISLVFFVVLCLPCLVLGHVGDDGTDEVMQWLIANGAEVNDGLHSDFFQYGDASVRGMLTTHDLAEQTSVLVIPKKLWLTPGRFPEFIQSELPSRCLDFEDDFPAKELKFAAALASEATKSSSSFYHPYLKHLPTMKDFTSFLPWLMKPALQSEFASLPLIAPVQQMQGYYKTMHACFNTWAKADGSPAKGLSWEQTLLGMVWIRTRAFSGLGTHDVDILGALIPGADMLNTAKVADWNVGWGVTETEFTMRTAGSRVASASELRDSYCPNCDNSEMLTNWGVYLEDNPNPVQRDAKVCAGEAGIRMKQVTLAALKDTAVAVPAGWRSPRCHVSVFHMEQGAVRCSLARLAWEMCAEEWKAAPSPHVTAAKISLVSHSTDEAMWKRTAQQSFLSTTS